MKVGQKRSIVWVDIFFVSIIPFFAFFATGYFHLTYIPTMILFFVIPSIYLSWRQPNIIKKTLIFSAVMFIPLVVIWDYVFYLDQVWYVPDAIRFLGGSIPLYDVIWTFFWVYYLVIFWEYFLDLHRVKEHVSKHLRYLIVLLSALTMVIFYSYFFNKNLLEIPFAYLKFGIIFVIIPMTVFLFVHHRIYRKLTIIGFYFLSLSALYDNAAVRAHQWWFNGSHYLGIINIGRQHFPLEEIIFWWILGVPAMIVWYEFFDDDSR